jgi:hypothetical protein
VEIRVTECLTTTEYVPTNAELRKMAEESKAVPRMVYRRMNFPDGGPAEYAGTNSHDLASCEKTQKGDGVSGVLRCCMAERGFSG